MTTTPPAESSAGSALDRMAASYVPTTGPTRPTRRQRRAQRRPPRPLPGIPAPLGRRLAARLIDSGIVLMAAGGTLSAVAVGPFRSIPKGDLVGFMLFLGILLGYEFVAIGAFGRTLGKWIMDLRVVNVSGYRAAWWSAAARAGLPCWLSVTAYGIFGAWCYLSPLADDGEWKRGWPDRVSRTVVVYRPDVPDLGRRDRADAA